jgi:4-oxalocrotonate tautomerase
MDSATVNSVERNSMTGKSSSVQRWDQHGAEISPRAGRQPLNDQDQPGGTMPLIQVKLIEGVFDAAEKETLIEKLTDAMVSVEGEAMRPVTWVTLEEFASGDWGIAGKALHTGDIVGMRSAAQ